MPLEVDLMSHHPFVEHLSIMRMSHLQAARRPTVPAFFLVLVALTTLMLPAHAQVRSTDGDRAERLSSALSERYDAIDTMRLRFVQTASSAFMDTDERYTGELTFSDIAYRIETSNQTIVADGTTTWVHNRGQRQVIINDFVEDESAFSLTQFLGSFSSEYRSTYQGSESLDGVGHERLRLTPTDDFAAFRQVDLWIRDRDGLVTRLIAVDLNDVRMVFELSSIEVNPTLDEGYFAFEMPEGVEQVDLREEEG